MPKPAKGGRRRSHTHSRKCSHRRRKYQKKRKTSRRSYYGGDLAPLSPHLFSGGGSYLPALSPCAYPGGGSGQSGGSLRPLSPLNYSQMGGSGGGDGKSTMMPHGIETSSIGNTDSSPAMVGGSQRGGFLGPALVPFGLLGAQKLYQNSRGTQRRFKRFPKSVKRSLNRYF